MALGRLRALEHQPLLEASTEIKAALAAQVRGTFAAETAGRRRHEQPNSSRSIDAFTSPEAWDVLRPQPRPLAEADRRTWRRGLAALIDDWNEGTNR